MLLLMMMFVVQCVAEKTPDGQHFILNGEKKWITNGVYADFFTVAVRTGGKGAGGLSLLLVERTMPGVTTKQVRASFLPPLLLFLLLQGSLSLHPLKLEGGRGERTSVYQNPGSSGGHARGRGGSSGSCGAFVANAGPLLLLPGIARGKRFPRQQRQIFRPGHKGPAGT